MTKVRNCLTRSTARTSGAGPLTQPIFQPVQEKVLPADEMRRVRSLMPGRVGEWTVDAGRVGEDQVLVDLVGDGDRVVLLAQLRDQGRARRG